MYSGVSTCYCVNFIKTKSQCVKSCLKAIIKDILVKYYTRSSKLLRNFYFKNVILACIFNLTYKIAINFAEILKINWSSVCLCIHRE